MDTKNVLPEPRTDSPCPLCGSAHIEQLSDKNREKGPLRTVICLECGLVWSDPFPHNPRSFYEESYRLDYKGSYQPKAKHVYRAGKVALARYAKLSSLLATPLTLLDVGVGGGEFAYLMKSLGHQVSGIEPNRGYAEYAKQQYDLNLQLGFVQEVQFPAASFDVITIWHVLEHTENPLQVLGLLGDWLKNSGTLVVEVPNIEATCQSPKSTFHDAHLFNFNLASLSKTAERAGLKLSSHQFSPDGGNMTLFFNKSEDSIASENCQIPGNATLIKTIVHGHTNWKHYTSLAPYTRVINRLFNNLIELYATQQAKQDKSLLDDVYAKTLKCSA